MPLHDQIARYLKKIFAADVKPFEELSLEGARERMRAGRINTSTEPTYAINMECDGVSARLYKPIYRVTKDDLEKKINVRHIPANAESEAKYAEASELDGDAGLMGLCIFIHGGGWVVGDVDCYDDVCAKMANQSGACILSLEYRLAPEHPFPAPLDDCIAATRWAYNFAETFGCDPKKMLISGDSAGGNLATLVAQYAFVPLLRQILIYPVTDCYRPLKHTEYKGSYKDCKHGYTLTAGNMKWFVYTYLTGQHEHEGGKRPDSVVSDQTLALSRDPRVSPLFASEEILADMPPALVITAEYDPLCDEGEEYAHRLSSLGVECDLVRYFGQVHAFFNLTHAGIDDAFLVVSQVANDIKKALQSSSEVEEGESEQEEVPDGGKFRTLLVGSDNVKKKKKKKRKASVKGSKGTKAVSEKKREETEAKRSAAEAALREEHSSLKHSALFRTADSYSKKVVAGGSGFSIDSEKTVKMSPAAVAKASFGVGLGSWQESDEVEGMGGPAASAGSADTASTTSSILDPRQLFGAVSTSPSATSKLGEGRTSDEKVAKVPVHTPSHHPRDRHARASKSPKHVHLLDSATKAREDTYSPYLKNDAGTFELTHAEAEELRKARYKYYDMVRKKQQAEILALTSSTTKNKMQIVLNARHDPTTSSHIIHTPMEIKLMREVMDFEGRIRGLEIEKKTKEYFQAQREASHHTASAYSHVVSKETLSAIQKAKATREERAAERSLYSQGHSKAYMSWVRNNLLADEESHPNAVRHKTITRESKQDVLVKQYAAIERKKRHAKKAETKVKEEQAVMAINVHMIKAVADSLGKKPPLVTRNGTEGDAKLWEMTPEDYHHQKLLMLEQGKQIEQTLPPEQRFSSLSPSKLQRHLMGDPLKMTVEESVTFSSVTDPPPPPAMKEKYVKGKAQQRSPGFFSPSNAQIRRGETGSGHSVKMPHNAQPGILYYFDTHGRAHAVKGASLPDPMTLDKIKAEEKAAAEQRRAKKLSEEASSRVVNKKIGYSALSGERKASGGKGGEVQDSISKGASLFSMPTLGVSFGFGGGKDTEKFPKVTKVLEGKEFKQQLTDIYKAFNPERLDTIDKIIKVFDGREGILLQELGLKYGFEVELDNYMTRSEKVKDKEEKDKAAGLAPDYGEEEAPKPVRSPSFKKATGTSSSRRLGKEMLQAYTKQGKSLKVDDKHKMTSFTPPPPPKEERAKVRVYSAEDMIESNKQPTYAGSTKSEKMAKARYKAEDLISKRVSKGKDGEELSAKYYDGEDVDDDNVYHDWTRDGDSSDEELIITEVKKGEAFVKQLQLIYKVYNPARRDMCERLAQKFHNREEMLLRELRKRYGFTLDLPKKKKKYREISSTKVALAVARAAGMVTEEQVSRAQREARKVKSAGGEEEGEGEGEGEGEEEEEEGEGEGEEYGPALGSGSTSASSSRANSPDPERGVEVKAPRGKVDKETGIISVKKSKMDKKSVKQMSISPASPVTEPATEKHTPLQTSTREAKAFVQSSRRDRRLEEREGRSTSKSRDSDQQNEEVRREIRALYHVYQPTKSKALVEKILTQFRGREDSLLKQLQKKFKVSESIHPSNAEGELSRQRESARLAKKTQEESPKARALSPHEAYQTDHEVQRSEGQRGSKIDKTGRSKQEEHEALQAQRMAIHKTIPLGGKHRKGWTQSEKLMLDPTTTVSDMEALEVQREEERIERERIAAEKRRIEAERAEAARIEEERQAREADLQRKEEEMKQAEVDRLKHIAMKEQELQEHRETALMEAEERAQLLLLERERDDAKHEASVKRVKDEIQAEKNAVEVATKEAEEAQQEAAKVLADRLAEVYSKEAQNMRAFIRDHLSAGGGLKVVCYRDTKKVHTKDKILKMDDKGRLHFSEAYAMKHVLRGGRVDKWPLPQLKAVKTVDFESLGHRLGSITHICKGKKEITLTFAAGNRLDPRDSSKALVGDLQFYIKESALEMDAIKCFEKVRQDVHRDKDEWMAVYAPRRMSISAATSENVSVLGTPQVDLADYGEQSSVKVTGS